MVRQKAKSGVKTGLKLSSRATFHHEGVVIRLSDYNGEFCFELGEESYSKPSLKEAKEFISRQQKEETVVRHVKLKVVGRLEQRGDRFDKSVTKIHAAVLTGINRANRKLMFEDLKLANARDYEYVMADTEDNRILLANYIRVDDERDRLLAQMAKKKLEVGGWGRVDTGEHERLLKGLERQYVVSVGFGKSKGRKK